MGKEGYRWILKGDMRTICILVIYFQVSLSSTCECPVGKYGDLCNLDCPSHCRENVCGALTGRCLIGCTAGYNGTYCNETCTSGTYGRNCEDTCDDCHTGCDPVTGMCLLGRIMCDPGFKGTLCNEACEPMTYGQNCEMKCGLCKNANCNPVTGVCIDGCQQYGEGPMCTLHCPVGKYGVHCNMNCPVGCMDKVCAAETGGCLKGCAAGYEGALCANVCPAMRYGPGCTDHCGLCRNSTCDPVNGTCLFGCISHGVGPLCVAPVVDEKLIIGLVVGIIILLILFIFLFLVCYRWCETPYKDHDAEDSAAGGRDTPPLKPIQPGLSSKQLETVPIVPHEETEYGSSKHTDVMTPPEAEEEDEHDMTLEDLANVVKQNMENDGKFLKDQFKTFQEDIKQKKDAASRLKNSNKNTVKAVVPYDHSRVILSNEEKKKSDYINASLIDGVRKFGEYIASQVPKASTVNDYWHMIWQEDIGKVVTLCNVNGEREGEEAKLTKHWPDFEKPLETNDFLVLRTKMKKYANYIVRFVKLIRKKTKEEKAVIMHQFTKWAPKRTPDPLDLVLFHRHVKSEKTSGKGPLLVSCSDGSGRTGTFIALDSLHSFGNDQGHLNVYSYVRKMRKNRMHMVQNEDQYVFLHYALAESFKQTKRAIAHQKNEKQYIMVSDEERQKTLSPLQRKYLDTISDKPVYKQEDYRDGLKNENLFRNKADESLPVDKYRPRLQTKFNGHTDYINARFISSYTEADVFIVTRFPLDETVVDLWRLIYDYKVTSLVIIGTTDVEETRHWLPRPMQSYICGPFVVSREAEDFVIYSNIVESKVKLVYKELPSTQGSQPMMIKVFRTRAWDSSSLLPPSYDVLNMLVDSVKKWREAKDHEKILVISKDSLQGCGIFTAVYNLQEQIDMDGHCDLYNTIRLIHVRYPDLLVSFEEFEFCQKNLKEYVGRHDQMPSLGQTEEEHAEPIGSDDMAQGTSQTQVMDDEKSDSLTQEAPANKPETLAEQASEASQLQDNLLQKLEEEPETQYQSAEDD